MKCRDCEHWGWGDDEGTPVWGWCWIRTSCPDPDIGRSCPDFLPKAPDISTALSTLQAENLDLQAQKVRWFQIHRAQEEQIDNLEAENKKLRAYLEQVKLERDVAVKDLEKLCRDDVGSCEMAICELRAYNNGAQCSRPDGRICDGYDVFNWKRRGPQKEDGPT